MNAILLRTVQPRVPSLLAFNDYREAEQGAKNSSVAAPVLEYELLELRVHPPNVNIDNETYQDRTLITLDSANRPGTLVEVVQLLTELGLCVIKARISSDGGWFVDEFQVTDSGKRVTHEKKLRAIRKVLSVDGDPGSDTDAADGPGLEEAAQCSTVFELAGNDRIGLLADVIELLRINGCEVRSAAVWTHNLRCAFVISVLDCGTGQPIKDGIKLARLRQLLLSMLDSQQANDYSVVNVTNTRGLIHYERRLHQLLLREEESQWRRQPNLAARYEQEISDQQALLERRSAAPPGAASTGLGPGSAAAAAIGAGAAGRQGAAARAQSMQLGGFWSGSGGAGGGGMSSASTALASPSGLATPSSLTASAATAAAAAANVTLAAGSPTMGSPEGSAHGGAACVPAGIEGATATASGAGPGQGPASAQSCGPGAPVASDDAGGGQQQQQPVPVAGSGRALSTPAALAMGSAAESSPASSGSSPPSSALPASVLAAPPSPSPPMAPPASSAQKPEVWVQHTKQHNYWLVSIRCRDRQKLLFDTVCTLADLNYDVYHGAVDCEVERDKAGAKVSIAVQTFYMRPRYGDSFWDPKKAAKLKYMLETAIQRRQPQGTKVHIQGAPVAGSGGGGGGGPGGAVGATDLPALTAVWRKFGLCITRAKVRALAGTAGEHTFYLVDNYGRPPSDTVVQQACQQIGGVRLARPEASGMGPQSVGAGPGAGGASAHGSAVGSRTDVAKFGFMVYSRPGWCGGGFPGSPGGSTSGRESV